MDWGLKSHYLIIYIILVSFKILILGRGNYMKKITMFIITIILVNLVLVALMVMSAIGSIFAAGMGMNFMEWIEFILACNGFIFITATLYLVYKIAKYILR